MKLIKQTISAPPRKLSAKWTMELLPEMQVGPTRRKKPETVEEEADEIIHRLKTPPAPYKTLEEELTEALAFSIAEELDREILEELRKPK